MKVEIHRHHPMSINAFADLHNLVMEVRQRDQSFCPEARYFAYFKRTDVKEGIFLRDTFGNGATPIDAINAYAAKISGEVIVVDAFSDGKRREILVPMLGQTVEQTLDVSFVA